jgi:hypothetical protein
VNARAAKWNVWSVDVAKQRALVVDEGAEKYARESAERRNRAALRVGMTGCRFVAYRDGEEPSLYDCRELAP